MWRLFSLLCVLAAACSGAKPHAYSTDLVMLEGGQVIQTTRLFVSGQKSRVEGQTAGPIGRIVTIARRDRGVTWTIYLDRRQYSEKPLATGRQPGKPDLASLDFDNLKKEFLGRATILGHPCTKVRITLGNLPNGRPMEATAWVADSLELPLRLETMGLTQESRNLSVGPQPAGLFEIPAGFTFTNSPGMPPGGLETAGGVGTWGGDTGRRPRSTPTTPDWKRNTNLVGGDYRVVDMATSDPTSCKATCDREGRCKAWTLVLPEAPGGMGYCYLKDSVPQASAEACCISGWKDTAGAVGGQVDTRPSRFQMEMDVNRAGEDYRDFIPARASAALCAEACAKESRCRAWTWVTSAHEPPTGHCWLKHRVPEPGPDECCVSGVKKQGGTWGN